MAGNPHPPPQHDKKTFTKASYSQPPGENQKGFLTERQKVQPFKTLGSLTTKSPIPKISWGIFDTAGAFRSSNMFRHLLEGWFCRHLHNLVPNLQVLEKRPPPKKKTIQKMTIRPHPRSLSPACWSPKSIQVEQTATFCRKNPTKSETTGFPPNH